jgi:hypothetical protein
MENKIINWKKPVELYILYFWMAVLSLNGLGGGLVFMIEPDGSLMGMTTQWLTKTPFNSFLFPGICLFILNGVFPLVALVGLICRKESKYLNMLNIFKDKYWGWTFSVYSGIITISWIIIQQMIADFFVLQPIITAIGLINLVLALLPRIQKRYILLK